MVGLTDPLGRTMTSRHGLTNVGNTCYLNSACQALFRTKTFVEYFGTDAWAAHRHPDRRGHDLAGQVSEIVAMMQTPGGGSIRPAAFVKTFLPIAHEFDEEIRPGRQGCAGMAIQVLLDTLHTQQSRDVTMRIRGEAVTADQKEVIKSHESWAAFFRKEYSPLLMPFYGQTQNKIVCKGCGNCSTTYQPWSILKVPVANGDVEGAAAPTLAECIREELATETIDDYACETCNKKGPAVKEHSLSKFPTHLILHIKRTTKSNRKIRCRIPYDPDNISLGEFCAWPSIQGAPTYRVSSTIEHMGGAGGGHYAMRHRDADGWFLYDDSAVFPSPTGGAASPDTYILVLERSN